ncbi:hypothetical protein KUCAC02_034667, partial [Chaenocephalus aceratus]
LREGGLLLSFDARVHTVANKELYSAMIGRVDNQPGINNPAQSQATEPRALELTSTGSE